MPFTFAKPAKTKSQLTDSELKSWKKKIPGSLRPFQQGNVESGLSGAICNVELTATLAFLETMLYREYMKEDFSSVAP